MPRSRGTQNRHLALMSLILAAGASSAQADPITPSYTITDLGAGPAEFPTSAGIALVSSQFGQTFYPFQQTSDTVLSPGQAVLTNFPLLNAPPAGDSNTYGNPANAFSYLQFAIMNSNGIAAAIDVAGVYGHQFNGTAYYAERNADGTWSNPVGLWGGNQQFDGFGGALTVSLLGINKLNQVLGSMGNGSSYSTDAALYNINSHTLINLSSYLAATGKYFNVQPIAIDDQGRIVVQANSTANNSDPEHTLLLTPDGVSSEPLEMPVPEPGTLAVTLLAIAGFAAHRLRERRRHP